MIWKMSRRTRHHDRGETISYRTDAESVGSQMDDTSIDMLDDVDKKILSASILGVDIIEVCSPERVARVAEKFGLVSGSSMDLANGWDFSREDHKRLASKRVREEAPYLLIGSPPCTYLSVLHELNKAVHGSKPGWT